MIPSLDRDLARWAADHLPPPFPNRIAEAIGALRPAAIRLALRIVMGLSPALGDGYFEVLRQSERIAGAWSAPEPAEYLRGLAGATEQAATTLDRVRDAVLPVVDTIELGQSVAASAVAAANAAGGAAGWSLFAADGSSEAARRTAVCRSLQQSLQTQLHRIESALDGLAAVLHLDPQAGIDALPLPRRYAPQTPPPVTERVTTRNLDLLTADLTSPDPTRRRFAAGVLTGLHRTRADGTHADLLIYNPDAFDGQGQASIAIGDLATADHIAILVPGIANSPVAMAGTAVTAADLRTQSGSVAPGEETAVVLWFGYDIPASEGLIDVPDLYASLSADNARAGGDLLANDTAWIARLAAPDATLSLVGHSMGSTTVSEAARFALPVDNLVLLGSPGAGYDAGTSEDYATVDPQNVYVLAHPLDPVPTARLDIGAQIGQGVVNAFAGQPRNVDPFGPDPADPRFGGQLIEAPSGVSGGGIDLLTENGLDLREHQLSNYLTGAAGLAVAGVITGRTSQVKRKHRG